MGWKKTMPAAYKGEVWQSDLGLAAKVRPCLVCHHTTALKGNNWEISIPKSFLKDGAFHLQQINTISTMKLLRKLGS
jgi:mRNA interferase MazF